MASRLAARAFARRGGAWWRPRRGLASYDASPRTYGEAPSSGTPEAFAASSVAQRVVLPDVCDHLRAHGYAVVDGALDSVFLANGSVASVLREEILSLADPLPGASSGAPSSAMRPNATVLVHGDGATTRLEKANIFEAEAHALAPERLATVPTLRAVAEDRSMLTLLNVMLPASDPTAALRFQPGSFLDVSPREPATGGDTNTPCQTSCKSLDDLTATSTHVSARVIFDTADLTHGCQIITPLGACEVGGSRHLSDDTNMWHHGEFRKLRWDIDEIRAHARYVTCFADDSVTNPSTSERASAGSGW